MSAIFRQQAMEHASSPEGLTAPLKVTGRAEWLALAGAAIAVLAAVTWGFAGSVPTTIAGSGILLRKAGGTLAVTAAESGVVAALSVEAGAEVKKGQTVAQLRLIASEARLAAALHKLETLRKQRDELAAYWNKYLPEQQAQIGAERSLTQEALRNAEEIAAAARFEFDAISTLNRDGLVAKPRLDQTRQAYFGALSRCDDLKIKLQGLEARLLALGNQRDQALDGVNLAIVTAEGEAATARETLHAAAMLIAPQSGIVTEIAVNIGDNVAADTRLVTISYGEPALSAVIYVPATTVEWLRPGMQARVIPGTVRPEEYGTALGTVASVSAFPASEPSMRRLINNDALVRSIMQAGPLLAVRIDLDRDPSTPSGLKWSSGRGPNAAVNEGSLAAAAITVREQPPASLIIPALRRLLGISAQAG